MMIKWARKIWMCQRGAMFGMDARIALIVLSVLAATGGISMLSRLAQSKVDATERSLAAIREGILDYYKNVGVV